MSHLISAYTAEELTEISLLLMSHVELQEACADAGVDDAGIAVKLQVRMRHFIRVSSGEEFDEKNQVPSLSHALQSELVGWNWRDGDDRQTHEPSKRIDLLKPMNNSPVVEQQIEKILKLCETWQKCVCPLSKELMFDPVLAEDGCLYDRYAIARHFFCPNRLADKERIDNLIARKSPVSGEYMGMRLMLIPELKTRIQSRVASSFFNQQLVDGYKRLEHEEHSLECRIRKAENGDIDAMLDAGWLFMSTLAVKTIRFDLKQALFWFKKAHAAGSMKGTYFVARCFARMGQESDAYAYTLLGAGRGQPDCLLTTGRWFFRGEHNLEIDMAEGIRCVRASVDADYATNGAEDGSFRERRCRNHLDLMERLFAMSKMSKQELLEIIKSAEYDFDITPDENQTLKERCKEIEEAMLGDSRKSQNEKQLAVMIKDSHKEIVRRVEWLEDECEIKPGTNTTIVECIKEIEIKVGNTDNLVAVPNLRERVGNVETFIGI